MPAMSAAHYPLSGVLYAEDFDLPEDRQAPGPDREPIAQTVVLEPSFSLADIQRATERALADGRSLERETAAQERDARRTDALCQIGASLRDAAAHSARIAAAEAASTARVVLAAVGAILPRLAASHALCEVSALIGLLIPAMEREPKLQIRVNPALIEPLRNDLATVPVAGLVELEWVAIETMELGDVAVKWQDGMMVRDTRMLCAEIGALLTQAGEESRSRFSDERA